MPASESTYSSWVGVIYVFNLIVGTGALTLPSAFAKAGWLLSTILLILLAIVSFITVTFIIECIACANATVQWRMIQSHKIDEESEAMIDSASDRDDTDEHTAIIQSNRSRSRYYSLNEKMGLGYIASLYFNRWGIILFYISLCIYLYGDLAIYAAAIGKSLADVMCTNNVTGESSLQLWNAMDEFEDLCWMNSNFKKIDVYRISVAVFSVLVGPFAYFNVQKTKYVQIFTTTMRWCAFIIMVTLACIRIDVKGQQGFPDMFEFNGLAALLGASVYSFMCHHSLPDLVAPFADKQRVIRQLGFDYILICAFYLLLALTGTFAFKELYDLYTLNFVPGPDSSIFMKILMYYLSLFPVFTLSTSFPIIALTLQNNLKARFLDLNTLEHYNFVLRRLTFPTIAVIPPVLVALYTHNLHTLVKFTGAYAGACIQYFIPAFLVLFARKQCQRDLGSSLNKYGSMFRSLFWIVLVICWGIVCIILVTVNFFSN
ncbi:Amino acid transporter [Oryctes borbonicus]|uniref:Amino acid transporter n=1 Tax=Oryctes borbonicus TaxID=1629725 RepID=A0A0T6BCW2_9SCAR|nr:Amino acid transporter [Oryctes borbonicus]